MRGFSFAVPAVKQTGKKKPANYKKYTILDSDVEGVVWINTKFVYSILYNGIKYPIIKECYDCEGVEQVYEQQLTDKFKKIRHIRSEGTRIKTNPYHYLPFTAGLCVKGNVVKNTHTGESMFRIKKVFIDLTNSDATEAIRFYKNNYTAIQNSRERLEEEFYAKQV